MIGMLRLLLPYLLALFFVYKGIKKPLYFLGIPFLMFMANSLFFDSAKLFHIPGSLDYALQFIWMVALWMAARAIRTSNGYEKLEYGRALNLLDYCFIILIIITIIGYISVITKYPVTTDVIHEF